MSDEAAKIEIKRGLKEVYFDRSRVCFIDGRAGELRYRGYSIHDLAQQSTFEETCYLLLPGELPPRREPGRLLLGGERPTRESLAAFDAELKAARTLPASIYEVIRAVGNAHPMDVL